MASKKGEYTMTWTTDPKQWKDSESPQKEYAHGNITPQEERILLGQFDIMKGDPDMLFCDLDWRAMVKRLINRPIEQ